jgi:ubiquinone biosynthesis protein
MRTFFSSPGYEFDLGETYQGFFLDVKRCPVAELMISKGVSDLCIQSWCEVDFGLVEIIGGKLQRNGTLAMGEQKCDFVFQPDQRT